ncbi:nucleotide disphospho-sugar-binding domain-containing protein [Streptomyces sp. NPDC059708]|uniref:nucleotide disphospho-sugar-binding domain-containing protein n=1 Tax=Streptomyces sp. NPDC059708 TaxID=3346916 RepID=UPI00369AEC31
MSSRAARVLVTVFPAASHLYPLVPTAWALRAAGHEVRLAVPPSFAPVALRTGLPVMRVGRDADLGAAWRGFSPGAGAAERTARTMAMFEGAAEAVAGDTAALAGRWADLVLFDPRGYAGPLAAALAGRPAVRFLYGVDHTHERRAQEWPLLEPLWRRWGAGAPGPGGDLTVDPCPAALRSGAPAGSLPVRHVPFNGAARVTAAPRTGAPRVCVTWGVSSGAAAGHLEPLRRTLAALAPLGCETVVLVAREQRALLGEVPHGVRVLESVPLHTVLPGCALVVHQGGAGTTLTAAACGVPQLVAAQKGDQIAHAERVAAAGLGRRVPASASAGALRAAVADVLADGGVRLRAAGTARENARRPAPARAAEALAALARHGR